MHHHLTSTTVRMKQREEEREAITFPPTTKLVLMATITTEDNSKWVNVTWMPHASLSQASHVVLSVRSVQALLDELAFFKPEEWQVRVTVHGIAGLPLVPVASSSPSAPLLSLRNLQTTETQEELLISNWEPLVSNVTHCCTWNFPLQIPVRWRDLPRDAFMKFEVIGHCDTVVS